mgnify:CR=1 FL=1
MDSRFQNNFFAKDQIVYHIGVQDSIVKLYEQAIQVAMEEKAACQQYLAGIANLILGMTMYYSQNYEFDNKATEQISKAKVFIRENLLKGIGPEEVADSLHMSYSWFRKLFKEYTGLFSGTLHSGTENPAGQRFAGHHSTKYQRNSLLPDL